LSPSVGAYSWRPSTRPPAVSTVVAASCAAAIGSSTVIEADPVVMTSRDCSATSSGAARAALSVVSPALYSASAGALSATTEPPPSDVDESACAVQPTRVSALMTSAVDTRIRLMRFTLMSGQRHPLPNVLRDSRVSRWGRTGSLLRGGRGLVASVRRSNTLEEHYGLEHIMGALDNIKDAAEATGKKLGRAADDAKERISDAVDSKKADADVKKAEADVKKAEADRDATNKKNDFKEDLRNS
jgi:hypothetical protein